MTPNPAVVLRSAPRSAPWDPAAEAVFEFTRPCRVRHRVVIACCHDLSRQVSAGDGGRPRLGPAAARMISARAPIFTSASTAAGTRPARPTTPCHPADILSGLGEGTATTAAFRP